MESAGGQAALCSSDANGIAPRKRHICNEAPRNARIARANGQVKLSVMR